MIHSIETKSGDRAVFSNSFFTVLTANSHLSDLLITYPAAYFEYMVYDDNQALLY